MKTPSLPLPKTLLAVLLFAGVAGIAPANSIAKLTPEGDHTFAAVREAKTTFDRDVERLKTEALADARQYAAAQGKEAKILAVTVKKPWYATGFPSAKVVFKLLAPGDPELTAPVTANNPLALAPAPAGAPTVGGTGTNDDLYTALLKLDDLRKRGILTEKEFAEEKKKILERSR